MFQVAEAQKRAVKKTDYTNIIVLSILHASAFAALFYFSWGRLFAMVALYSLSCLGITIGYHRLLTHRSFKTPKWLEYSLATVGALAFQGGPIGWVAEHRLHHIHSDQPLDPHNIKYGFWYAHMGWFLKSYPQWYLKELRLHYAPDLVKDPYYRWLETYLLVPTVILGLILLAVGGFPLLLWAVALRLVLAYHATWFVNSAAHLWGYRPFQKELATNNWWVALLAMGEGWHNNHHAFPTSAKHGLRFWEFDASWILIWAASKLGLVKNIRRPSDKDLPWKQRRLQTQTLLSARES